MHFEFATAARILFGPGSLREVGAIVKSFGQRALVVAGRTASRAQPLIETVAAAGVEHSVVEVCGEPSIEQVIGFVELARQDPCPVVIGFGGGSAIDAAKAIAGIATNPGDVYDYLEVIGKGKPLLAPGLPCVAVPTTAGTGAEVTKNAVLASKTAKVKVSLRSPFLLPRAAIVDPELTFELPPDITVSTGLDALTQLIEPYTCLRPNPVSDAFCLEGITRVVASLREVFESPKNEHARENMALASLLGGLSLANAGLGAVHGFAGPIGGSFSAPHGAICAALLPHV
ncbi:MAG: iron-containing alcohol dehydrogenase, partial [Verrucomicrobia bacterium]|nr:iron-containing alcohol dehydrogenase [Verrucomicrobiota bacterium]